MSFSKKNRIFVNSLPKSGTHLLSNTVELFGYRDFHNENCEIERPSYFNYQKVSNALREENRISEETDKMIHVGSLSPLYVAPSIFLKWLATVPEREYIVGHISYSPALIPLLEKLNYTHLFIIRDPRAVLISMLSFIPKLPGMLKNNWHWGLPKQHYLKEDLDGMTASEQLNFIMEGGYASRAGEKVINFADVYRSMLDWSNDPNCLVVRFEDLIGEQGGGSSEKQKKTVKDIAHHLGHACDKHIISKLDNIYSPFAPTFRTGQIDSWKKDVDADMVNRIMMYCEPLCREAGYCKGNL